MADNGSKFVQDLAQIGKATAQGGAAQDMLNEAINRGNAVAADNQILQDRQNLTPFEFGQKYPQAVQGQLDQLDQGNAELQNYMKGATRDGFQAVGDTAVDAATGLVGTLGGIAAMGAGGVHPALGVETNKLVNDLVTFGRSHMSQDVKRNEYLTGIQGKLDNQDTATQYEQDQQTDGALVAGLKKIGRDTLNAGSRTIQNPTILKSTVAQGVGSLLAGGPIGKGLRLLGVAEKFAMPAAIGLMEGGGAYGQTVSDIMGRSHEDLMQTSPDYRAAIQAGTDPEAAKTKIANNAGLTAAAVQGVAGAAIGKVAEVGPFEAAPFKLRPVADVASNLVKEPLEEAAQSLTGQVTQNAAIKMQADPNQSLTEGVGDQVALGAIGGLGSAGVVQAPSVAAGTLYHTAKAAGAALIYPVNKLMAAGEQQQAENQAASPVSSETLAPAVQEAATTAPQVAQGLQTLATESGAKKEDADAYINRVSQASQLTETDMQGVPPALAADLKGFLDENKLPQNKFTALHFMAEVAANKDNSTEERVAAGTFVAKNIENNKKLFTEDFPAFLDNIPHDRPEFQQFNGYASILNAIQDNPEIQQAIKYASEDMKMPEQDLSGIDFGSAKGQQLVDHATEVASVAPHAVDLNTANMILSQADSGKVKLLPAARRMLSSAVALQNVAALRANLMKLIGTPDLEAAPQAPTEDPREMLKFVTQQIKETGGRKADHLSLSQHLAGINQAVTQNDLKGAQAKAQRLANFAQSRINKLVAVNESIANGDGKDVQYKNWSGTDFYTDKKGVGAKLGSAGGRAFARTVYADARAVAQLSNDIAKIYPAFQLKQLTVPELGTNNQVNINKVNEGSSTTAASQPSQATTSKTVDVVQKELPSPPTQSARETISTTPAVEEVKAVSTGTTENTSSEPVVEPVQSAAKPNAEPVASASADQAQTKESADPKFEITGNGKIEFSEPAQTQEEPKDEAPGLAGRFPNLVQPASGNMFHKAFTLPKTAKSRLLGMAEPMRAIWKALGNENELKALRDGKDIDGYDLTGADAKNLRRLIQKGADALNLMTASLEAKIEGDNILPKIADGALTVRTRDLRILNVLDVDDKGGYQYNPDLIQSAMLAGLDWVLNIAERSSPMKADEVAGILGIDEGEAVQYLDDFNRGMSLTIAKRSLAERIQKFWGVNASRDGRKGFTVGIPEAVAAEMLMAFDELGLINLRIQRSKDVDDRLKFPNVGPDKNFNWVWMDARSQENQAFINNFDKVSKFFTDMALTDREGEGASIGSPIQEVAQTQHRNPMVQLTKQNKEALFNAQQTPYRPNTIVHDFFQALTEERYVSLLVARPYKKGDLDKTHKQMGLNKGHWKSLQGQMRSYVSSYRNVARQMEQVKAYAKKQGIPLEEAAVYYGHDINKLGRPQMRGLSNPQTDKGAREVFMSTGSELDLSGNAPDMDFFLQTIGQGIGLKTEQDTRQVIVQKVMDKVFTEGGEFYPLVQTLKTWVENRDNGGDLTIPDSVDAQMKGLSQHGIHSLISAARYLLAKETNQDLSKFKTSNYLEADGKTNGPINALMLFASGAFSPGWLKAIGKGGAFVGRLGQTLNSWGDKVDLYKDGANVTQVKMEELGKNIAANGSPEAAAHFQTFLRLMKGLNANIKVNESGEITIERNLTKNPLTITIYGSGPRGIAGKVAGELVTAIYEKMSDGISNETPFADSIYGAGQTGAFLQDLSALTSQSIRQNRESKKFFVAGNVQQVGGQLDTFEFSKEQFNTLRDNVHTMLITPMVAAINAQVTQHIAPVKDALLKATQLQSIVLKNMFVTEVAKRIAVMKADPEKFNYRDTEFLSQKELDEIMDNLKRFSPIINTGTQAYMLSGGETSDLGGATNPEDYSRTLKSKLSTPAFVTGPTTVGVGGVPTLTIGSGDAQMMMNFLAENPEAAKRVLHVFDGLNVPADQIENYSNLINQSVFKTWTSNTNPVRAIHDSFKAFMDAAPIEALFTGEERSPQQLAALNEMTRVDLGRSKFKDDERITPAEAKLLMDRTLNQLSNLADDTDIRRQILAEMPFSVDQMAGGEKPHVNQGKIQLPEHATDEQILDAMNARRAELSTEQSAVIESIEPTAEQPKAPVKTIAEFANQRGFHDENSGATVLTVRQLDGLSGMSDMTATQKEMLDASIEALRKQNYTLVFGNEDQLDAWERDYNADLFVPGSNSADFGRTYVGKKLIVIKNMTAETLVHELVHASTIQKTANPSSKEEREAVARLGNLMEQWLDETYPDITDQATDDAFEGARSVIDGLQAKGDQVGALNEFMAYVLSNQDLAKQAAKTTVKNPLVRIIGDALAALKALIFGKTKVTDPGEDLLANLRFNTRILMGPQTQVEGLKQDFSDTVLHQSASFGSSDRLTAIREAFNQKIVSWINDAETGKSNAATKKAARDLRQIDADNAKQSAADLATTFAYHFQDLGSMQAFSTFSMIQQALMTEARLNTNSLARVGELHRHVMDKLKVEDFMQDPDLNDPNDRHQAQDKLNALSGVFQTKTDKYGRSSLMSSFLALALTSDGFRKILSGMEVPKSEKSAERTMDAHLENAATAGMDRLGLWLAGEKGSDVQAALDSLTASMLENVGDQRSHIAQNVENRFDQIERVVADKIQETSSKINQKAQEIKKNTKSRAVKAAASVAIVAATIINETDAELASLGLTAALNKHGGFDEIRSLVNEVQGRTRENAPIYDMISKVRAWVQQTRQQYRDELPIKLAKAFTKPVSQVQWTAMFKALGKTDLAALTRTFGVAGALDLVTKPQRVAFEIKSLERALKGLDANRFDRLKAKSEQLADYMMTGNHGPKLLRNAEAIARLLGERGMKQSAVSAQLVDAIDRLVSLYALQKLDADTIETVSNLVKDEMKGLDFVTNYLVGQRVEEMGKAKATTEALYNHYKGHIPSEAKQGGSLIIASDSEHAHLISRGYKHIADYTGSSADRSLGKRSYYFAPVSGTAIFNQGVLQTVHQTASGVDPETGYTTGEIMAGRIDDAQTVKLIDRHLANAAGTNENLLPVYDDAGNVVAFERAADPERLGQLNRSTDLAKMIGVWRGRQVEELAAQESNKELVDNLFAKWEEDRKAGRASEYVNIAKLGAKDDRVLIEATKLIPNQARDYIKAVFGPDTFMVRRDMLLDTFGGRQASIGDLFTGKTRWNPTVSSAFEKLAMGAFGNKAYPSFVSIEKNIQEFVSTAKTRIVVKSVIVPAANAVSNMFQLLNRGVPFSQVVRGFGAKTSEINAYIKGRQREVDLEADLRAAQGKNDLVEIRKIENKIQSLKDSYKRMSIWPLVEAGEFSAISNGNVTTEDLALADGKWSDWVEQKARELPAGFNTAARYALVTKDTALFQGLARSVQYGDFVAKAVLYDDMIGRQKMTKAEALGQVGEPFVNYDRLSGRSMQYLDSIGLMWFYKYKIRIMKEAAHMLRHNPLRSLLMTAVPNLPLIGDIGSPTADNVLSIGLDGKLGWSLGPNMGLHSFGLNPWLNLAR